MALGWFRGAVVLRSFVAAFVLVFKVTQGPWHAPNPPAREAVGVGAFNLVGREAYVYPLDGLKNAP